MITRKQYPNHHVYETEIGGRAFTVETGKVAELADAECICRYGDTVVLTTVTCNPIPKAGIDYFPLTIEFEERMYSVGRIPGSFNRREGKPSERGILNSRIIDRPMRPLFDEELRNDTVVTCTVLANDYDNPVEIVASLGASIAIACSDVPWNGPVATTNVAHLNGKYIINPSSDERDAADCFVCISSTFEKVVMIETEAKEAPENIVYECIRVAHEANMEIVKFINSIVAEIGKPKFTFEKAAVNHELLDLFRIPSGSAAAVFAYMLPAYAADVGIAILLMRFARKRGFSESACLYLGGLAVFNPAAVILSGAWGQIDSILTLLLLLSFSELFEGRRISAGAIYGLAIMTKWQALIYGPVLAAEYLLSIRKKEDALRTAGGVAAALLVIFAVSLPFRGDQGFFWVVGRFLNSAGGYDYASVEAYNFLALCGGNWKSAELSLVPGISYKAFGMVMIVLAVVLSVAMQVVSRRREGGETLRARPERLLIPAAFCMFMIFTFGHYMHERYVFPVMALLAFAYAATRENRLLVSSMLLSVVLALNETTAMYVVSNAASAAVRGTQQHQIVIGVCSLFEVLTFFYTAKVCLERGFGQKDRR